MDRSNNQVRFFICFSRCIVSSISIILWELFTRVLEGKYIRPYSEYPQVTLGYTGAS